MRDKDNEERRLRLLEQVGQLECDIEKLRIEIERLQDMRTEKDEAVSDTPVIPEPTEADLARDAAADLVVCQAATGGTWDGDADGITIAVDDDGKPTDKPSRWYKVFVIARPPLGLDPDECLRNVQLILLARTALPAWIKRAEAERKAHAVTMQLHHSALARIEELEDELRAHGERDE